MTEKEHGHWLHQFDDAINELKRQVHGMGELALMQCRDATRALVTGDRALADAVIERDGTLNALEVSVDRAATLIIAKYQPKAVDLRLVFGIAKMSTDFERMGDQARHVAEATRDGGDASFAALIERTEIARECEHVLSLAVMALKHLNEATAVNVLRADEALDRAYATGLEHTLKWLRGDAARSDRAMRYLNVLRAYERMGDHATNIAEHVIFICDGEDIRHLRLDDLARRTKTP